MQFFSAKQIEALAKKGKKETEAKLAEERALALKRKKEKENAKKKKKAIVNPSFNVIANKQSTKKGKTNNIKVGDTKVKNGHKNKLTNYEKTLRNAYEYTHKIKLKNEKKKTTSQIKENPKKKSNNINKIEFNKIFNQLEVEYKDNNKNRIPINRKDDSNLTYIFMSQNNTGMGSDKFEFNLTDTK